MSEREEDAKVVGVDVEWREDIESQFKGTHVFGLMDCYWSSDPDIGPDVRSVCMHCGLDEKLGNPENPCTKS